jgi:hypothetical protein
VAVAEEAADSVDDLPNEDHGFALERLIPLSKMIDLRNAAKEILTEKTYSQNKAAGL